METIAGEMVFTAVEERAAAYSHGGRPACRVGVLLRVMILQHLYVLSDPQAEEQLKDRLSFQKFVQLDAHETVPDATTLCRFRQRLGIRISETRQTFHRARKYAGAGIPIKQKSAA
ncbi:MAG: transposase [Verrucomicrobia bacterium]|nr:transposase [Verrucomicrobiota bacterium]